MYNDSSYVSDGHCELIVANGHFWQEPEFSATDSKDGNFASRDRRLPPSSCVDLPPWSAETQICKYRLRVCFPVWGRGTPLFPLVHLLPHLSPFYFSLSFIGFTYFLLLSIPSLSTRIVPLHFQAGGRRKRPNLGLVCCVCVICIPWLRWILVFCSIWFDLVLCVPSVLWHCWLGHLTRKNPSPIWPIMCFVGR